MSIPPAAKTLMERIDGTRPLNTELRVIAKEQGKDSEFAAHLWTHGGVSSRMLSLLILEPKTVDVPYMERLISDIEAAGEADQSRLLDWMIAHVITKKGSLKNETVKWRSDPSTIRQRVF